MRVWRICRKPFASDPLSGRGALFASGRWHTRGRRIIYSSSSIALAALEFLVHVDRDEWPADLVRIEIEIPDDLKIDRVDIGTLPRSWRDYPAPKTLQQVGNQWLEEQHTVVLEVPSAVIPEEPNYLLNPAHPEAGRVSALGSRDFIYDSRLTH